MKKVLAALAVTWLCCGVIAAGQATNRFDRRDLYIVRNKGGVGGRLMWGRSKPIEVYAFEKSMQYLVSPDLKRIAITDTGGTAAFSVFVIDLKLNRLMVDYQIYRLKPELRNYSAVYPTVRRWLSSSAILVHVYAYGPFEEGIPRQINFNMTVEVREGADSHAGLTEVAMDPWGPIASVAQQEDAAGNAMVSVAFGPIKLSAHERIVAFSLTMSGAYVHSITNIGTDWSISLDSSLQWRPALSGSSHHGATAGVTAGDLPVFTIERIQMDGRRDYMPLEISGNIGTTVDFKTVKNMVVTKTNFVLVPLAEGSSGK